MRTTIRLFVLTAMTLTLTWLAYGTTYKTTYCGQDFSTDCDAQNGVAPVGVKWTCTSSQNGNIPCVKPSCSGACLYPVGTCGGGCGGCGGGGGGGCGCE
jgi:hypothetical protein